MILIHLDYPEPVNGVILPLDVMTTLSERVQHMEKMYERYKPEKPRLVQWSIDQSDPDRPALMSTWQIT